MRAALAVVVLGGCEILVKVEPIDAPTPGTESTTEPTTEVDPTTPTTPTSPTTPTVPTAGAPCGGDCEWILETVDVAAWEGLLAMSGFPTFDAAVGPDGVSHVVLFDPSAHEVRYVSSDGWAAEVLWTTPAHLLNVAQLPGVAIEVGADGVVHVASGVGDYGYGRFDGAWATETFPSGPLDQGRVAMALDGDDVPHVFFDRDHVERAGSSWREHAAAPGLPEDVAMGPDGATHAVWNTTLQETLRHGLFVGGVWEEDVVVERSAGATSMAVGPDGATHLAFLADGALLYATDATGAWVVSEIDAVGGADAPSLALDAAGRPQVVWRSDLQNRVTWAWWSGDEWVSEAIAEGGAVTKTVLRLDPTTGDPVVFLLDDASETVIQLRAR